MLRVPNLSFPLDVQESDFGPVLCRKLRIKPDDILSVRLSRKSVDARDKGDVHFVLTLDVSLRDEERVLRGLKPGIAQRVQPPREMPAPVPRFARRPLVVGAGPAGLFAALELAQAGARPILIERGKAVFTHLAWTQKGFEPHAMYREGLGWIGVEAGTAGDPRPYNGPDKNLQGQTYLGGSGIAHILAKHPGAEKLLADVIEYGDVYHHRDEDSEHPNFRKITIVKGDHVVVLSKFRTGRLLITAFDPGENVDSETGETYIDKKARQKYIASVRSRKPFGESGGKK